MTQEAEDESAKLLREFNARHSLEDAPVETPKAKSATAAPEAAPAAAASETDSALAEFYKTHGIPRDVVPPVITTPEEALSPGDAALAGGAAGWLAGKQPLQSAAYGSAEAARAADAAKVARAGMASAAEALAQSQGAHCARGTPVIGAQCAPYKTSPFITAYNAFCASKPMPGRCGSLSQPFSTFASSAKPANTPNTSG